MSTVQDTPSVTIWSSYSLTLRTCSPTNKIRGLVQVKTHFERFLLQTNRREPISTYSATDVQSVAEYWIILLICNQSAVDGA